MWVFILLYGPLSAQLSVIQGASMGMTPEQLVREYLVGKGVVISNVTLNGSAGMISKNHIGYFNATGGAYTQLNMEGGLLMTSGRADYAIGPNNTPSLGFRSNTGTDPDLELLTGSQAFDACVLEFDFIPQCDTLRFRYAFGSEEFYEFCGKNINDAFGFLLSGPGIQGEFSNNSLNIAIMPGGSGFVTINNICPDSAAAWNNQSGSFLQYDAMTWVYTAWHKVVPFRQYHLKLVIGDDADQTYDSGVFLEKGSFSSGFDFSVSNSPSNPQSGSQAIEGCNDIIVWFTLPQPAQTELQVDFSFSGTASGGIDYSPVPGSVAFMPGQDSAALIIHPIPDGITEGPETVILEIFRKTCSGTIMMHDTITILDYSPMSVSVGDDMTICPGDSIQLVASVSGGLKPFTYSWNYALVNDSVIMVTPGQQGNSIAVNVTDRCGIYVSDSIIVHVEPVALLTNQPASSTICSGNTAGIILTSNISKAYFSWDPLIVSGNIYGSGSGTGSNIDQVLTLNSDLPGMVTYRIRVTGNGCDTTYTNYLITVNPLPYVELGETVYTEPGSILELHAGPGFSEYLWSTESSDSVIMVYYGGTYWVNVANQFGCEDSDTILVVDLGMVVPNAFSPNGDGLNDRFRIKDFKQNETVLLQIFNRWGNLIFETHDLDKGWDGTSADGPSPADTYVWIIHFRSGRDNIIKGTVTVIL